MSVQELKALARKHWVQWLPEKVRELKAEGKLNEALHGAANLAQAEIEHLMKKGYSVDEAREVALPMFILLPPEPTEPDEQDEELAERERYYQKNIAPLSVSREGTKVPEAYSAELYRQEGDNFRSVRLNVRSDGSIRLDAQDMGKLVEEVWGDDDYEFWVDVPATALHKLVFALIREKYSGRSGSVDEFRAFCTKEGIEHKWDSWT
jgi:hypothetical protein